MYAHVKAKKCLGCFWDSLYRIERATVINGLTNVAAETVYWADIAGHYLRLRNKRNHNDTKHNTRTQRCALWVK